MNNEYNKEYLENTFLLIKSLAEDLDKWSVYNGDLLNEETGKLNKVLEEIEEKI